MHGLLGNARYDVYLKGRAAHAGKTPEAGRSALLAACEGWLWRKGHAEACLSTGRDTRAFAFYLRRGWRETDETAGHFAEDAVLRKTLSTPL